MESSGKAFTRHLTAEQHYAVKQCNVLRGPVSMLRQEMLAKSEAHTVSTQAHYWNADMFMFPNTPDLFPYAPYLLLFMCVQQTHAETWGSYSYYTEQTKERPLVAYMRQNAQGDVDSVLDVNDIQANSNLISVGQVKLEPNQQLVAYTVDTTSGGESYEALVQTIGGKPLFRSERAKACAVFCICCCVRQ